MKDYVTDSDKRFQLSQSLASIVQHKAVIVGVLVLAVIFFNFPIYYTFVSSLKTLDAIHAAPMELIPTNTIDPIWKNYTDLWTTQDFDAFTSNSIMIAVVTTAFVMVFGTLGGYGFSRFRFPYDNVVFIGILAARLLPPVGMLVPFFRFFQNLQILDTEYALIIVYIYLNLPLAIWLMRNFFISIPVDLDEAAYVDGATRFQTFKDVILPIAKPGIAAVAILTFLFSWREFLMALVMTVSPKAITVPVGATMMVEDVVVLWNFLAGAAFLAMLPGLLFVVAFQRYIVSGLTRGAVKG